MISGRVLPLSLLLLKESSPFIIPINNASPLVPSTSFIQISTPPIHSSPTPNEELSTNEENEEKIGNLVADDEWMGLSMELTELVRCAVIEDVKKTTRDFIGKEDYKIGDISKEIDARVKDEVSTLRNKEEYELGDLSLALDQIAKDMTCELTGKEDYEVGDLSREIDARVKDTIR